jgi:hypothetical protein
MGVGVSMLAERDAQLESNGATREEQLELSANYAKQMGINRLAMQDGKACRDKTFRW